MIEGHAAPKINDSLLESERALAYPKPKNQKDASAVPRSNSNRSTAQASTMAVGKSACAEGRIEQCETCFVAGSVEGYIASRYLEVDIGGRVSGEANVEEAVIAGEFSGKLTVSGRLQLKSGAKVVGEVSYSEIAVEAGALLSGQVAADGVSCNRSGWGVKALFERLRR